jgi:hypothetical protein
MTSSKLAMLSATFCAVMLAFSQNVSAEQHPLPPVSGVQQVPDGGTTVMLLGAALCALGMARLFLKSKQR